MEVGWWGAVSTRGYKHLHIVHMPNHITHVVKAIITYPLTHVLQGYNNIPPSHMWSRVIITYTPYTCGAKL